MKKNQTKMGWLFCCLLAFVVPPVWGEEPWRPETAAAVGRALAVMPSSEEENELASASIGGVEAGISPAFAEMRSYIAMQTKADSLSSSFVTCGFWQPPPPILPKDLFQTRGVQLQNPAVKLQARNLFETKPFTQQERQWKQMALKGDFSFIQKSAPLEIEQFTQKLHLIGVQKTIIGNSPPVIDRKPIIMAHALNAGITTLNMGTAVLDLGPTRLPGTNIGLAGSAFSLGESIGTKRIQPLIVSSAMSTIPEQYSKQAFGASLGMAAFEGRNRYMEVKDIDSHLLKIQNDITSKYSLWSRQGYQEIQLAKTITDYRVQLTNQNWNTAKIGGAFGVPSPVLGNKGVFAGGYMNQVKTFNMPTNYSMPNIKIQTPTAPTMRIRIIKQAR